MQNGEAPGIVSPILDSEILDSFGSILDSEFPDAVRRVPYFRSSHFTLTGTCRSHCIVSVTPDTSNAQALDCALRSA